MYLSVLYNFHAIRAPVPRQMLHYRGAEHCVSHKEHRPVRVPIAASIIHPLRSLCLPLLHFFFAKLRSPRENKWFAKGGKAPGISHMHPNQHSQAQDKDTKQPQGKPLTFLY